MNKKISKILSGWVPKGELKEWIKHFYYNITSAPDISFSRPTSNVYSVTLQGCTILSSQPYYHFVNELRNYQSFYSLKKDDIIIDAGCNAGLWSLYAMKQIGNSGVVFAFEPDEINCGKFLQNIGLNQSLSNFELVKDLLWSHETDLAFNEVGSEGSSVMWIKDQSQASVKHSISLDLFVKRKKLEKLDFIKMDIEGAEIEALEGCVDTMKRLQPNFAIASYHIINGSPTYLALESFFKRHDYPFKTVLFERGEYITFAGPSVRA